MMIRRDSYLFVVGGVRSGKIIFSVSSFSNVARARQCRYDSRVPLCSSSPVACILSIFHFCWHAIGLATVMLTMVARVIQVSAARSTTSARPRRRPIAWLCCIFLSIIAYTQAYHRAPCKKIAVKYQFQFRCVVSLAIAFMFDDFAGMCSHL